MIKNFNDHAANERTFLAWVRTAVAIVGFGIIVERMDMFGGPAATGSTATGLVLVVVGIGMFAIAAYRFLALRRQISDDFEHPSPSIRADVLLAGVLTALAVAVGVFALHMATGG
ncbi:MAG: DUF202 domain-containing protein [Hyphomicrobiales bacterium]